MIRLKTSVLVAAALKMGAIVAETNDDNANLIYDFGLNLGLAFQLQDDYLDTFGNSETFGKQIGGDIIENKKTYLYLKALEVSNKDDKGKLKYLYRKKIKDNTVKIADIRRIFQLNDIPLLIKEEIKIYTEKAFNTLAAMDIKDTDKQRLKDFGLWLMNRSV
jgi:geranylgeranyl diphosphate synthase type II